MIEVYGITQRGRYHENDGAVCQDAHKIVKKGDFVFAAVADGVGSNTHSHIASQIAAEESVEYCAKHIDESKTADEILGIMKEAFHSAKVKIDLRAKEEREEFPEAHKEFQFHTTLTLAAYREGKLYFGQSGDSGILAFTTEGRVELVTVQHRDKEGRVFPLAYGETHWQFGTFGKEAASILLATDGVLEAMLPKCFVVEPGKIYVAMACYFMDNAFLRFPDHSVEKIKSSREKYMTNVMAKEIYDDLTVAVIVDTNQTVTYQEDSYYEIPKVILRKRGEKKECEYQEEVEESTNCVKKSPVAVKAKFTKYKVSILGLPKFTKLKSVLENLKRK